MFIKLYLLAFAVFFAIDLVWLVFIARSFYKNQLDKLLATSPNWLPAIIFYLIFVAGLTFFVISPNKLETNMLQVFLIGAFFGLVAYATYDLTNLATLKDWPLTVTIVDLIWGAFLGGSVSLITVLIAQRIF